MGSFHAPVLFCLFCNCPAQGLQPGFGILEFVEDLVGILFQFPGDEFFAGFGFTKVGLGRLYPGFAGVAVKNIPGDADTGIVDLAETVVEFTEVVGSVVLVGTATRSTNGRLAAWATLRVSAWTLMLERTAWYSGCCL